MDVALYTGNGAANTITGLAFSPDLVWMKVRSTAYNHTLIDSVRGATKTLSSSMTVQEYTEPTGPTAFTADGWSMSGDVTYVGSVNASGQTYVGWAWDAGTSTVSNTQGSITSQVRANATAGFSVVTYSLGGNGSTLDTVGHGLGVTPGLVICKNRDTADNWYVGMPTFANPARNVLVLNSTASLFTLTSDSFSFSSTLVGIRQNMIGNGSGQKAVVYAFAPVSGYSAMSSYVSTGTSDNAFQYCGFRPRFILLKNASVTNSWVILDAARSTYNAADDWLGPNSSSAEDSNNAAYSVDFLSNGFKVRSGNGILGNSGDTVIWAAFAESPFNYSRAR